MDREKLKQWSWFAGGLLLVGVILGTEAYAVTHDDPVPFLIGILLAFPTSMMLALGYPWKTSL